MAQDSNHRAVRSDQPYSGDPAQGGQANDPLAELARLIGQDDPFAGVSRPPSRASAQGPAQDSDPQQPYDQQQAPHWLTRRAPEHYAGYDDQSAGAQHDAAYDDPQYQHDPRYQDPHAYPSADYYDDGQYYADESYEEPRQRRFGLKAIAAAVIGVAVLGVGGVYGYRALTGPATGGAEPPVIRADEAPMKTVPAAPASEPQLASKQYDRVGDRGGERLVPREEQPVDPKQATRGMQPPPKTPGSVLPPLAAPAQTAAVANGSEPKKVQTITIRPEAMALAPQTAPQSAPAPTAQPPAPAAQPRVSAVPPSPPAPRAESGTYVQASFRALQQKYPSVLGSYQATIRRADLGDKGVRYRAQIGPFATLEEARQVCNSLKTAGGQCFVPNANN
jgi:sporulation related protein